MQTAKSLFLWVSMVALAGCDCGALGVDTTRFACSASEDCLEGFVCLDVGDGPECLPVGTEVPEADAGPVDAGEADAGLPDAGVEEDAGVDDAGADDDAGTPDAAVDFDAGLLSLHFLTTQQNVAVNGCSAIALVEARADGVPYAVPQSTPVTLASSPGGVSFYENPTCTGMAATSVNINTGSDNVDFYMRAASANVYAVEASSPGFTSAAQDLEVGVSPQIITLAGVPGSVRGGECTAGVVELRRAGVLDAAVMPVNVALSAVNAGQVRFYSSSSCSSTTSNVTINTGASSTQFWMKPLTGGAQTIIATAPFDGDQLSFSTTPIVRRSSCFFAGATAAADGGVTAGTTQRSCTISPPVSDMNATLVLSQFTASLAAGTPPNAASARCRLTAVNAVTCTRSSEAVNGNAVIQVAEVPQNLRVQRVGSSACPGSQPTAPLDGGPVPFVLRTVNSSTATITGNHLAVARFVDPDVTVTPAMCGGYEHQVAEWNGVTVTTGELDGGFTSGQAEATVTGLPAVSPDTVLLVQASPTNSASIAACEALVRGDLASPTSVTLTRGAVDAGCPLSPLPQVTWQRIDFGARADVDTYRLNFAPNQTTQTLTIAPVDSTRALVLASNQSFGGQGAGETAELSSTRVSTGTFSFTLTSNTSVTVTRPNSGSAASVTVYVVELTP